MYYFEKHTNPELSLWRAVIIQTMLDCLTQSKRKENIDARNDALQWFNINNKNFIRICKFANLEPSFVLKQVQNALKNQSWRRTCDIGKGMQFINMFNS